MMSSESSSASDRRDEPVLMPHPEMKTSKICGVCGDAARCYHFGGLCCASCKAFFRRAVVNDQYKLVSLKVQLDKHKVSSFFGSKVSMRVRRILQDRRDDQEALLSLPTQSLSIHRYGKEVVRNIILSSTIFRGFQLLKWL